MKKKLGLALGAGGSRGVAHIGFLQALEEEDLRPDLLCGSSMGAVVGGLYAAGVSPLTMKREALGLKLRNIASLNPVPLRQDGFLSMKKARKRLVELMGERSFSDLSLPFACVATDMLRGESVLLCEGCAVDAMLASAAIPGVFSPVGFANFGMLSDGGILERVPTQQVKNMGADVVVAVDVLGDLMEKKITGRLVNTVLRYIDIMDTHFTRKLRESRDFIDLWLEPDLGGMDQYKVKRLGFAYKKGYELGKEHAGEIRRLIGG